MKIPGSHSIRLASVLAGNPSCLSLAPLAAVLPAETSQTVDCDRVSAKANPEAADISVLTAAMSHQDESAYREFYRLYFNRLLRYLLVVASGNEDQAR